MSKKIKPVKIHFFIEVGESAICGNVNASILTNESDEVDCKACIKKLLQTYETK